MESVRLDLGSLVANDKFGDRMEVPDILLCPFQTAMAFRNYPRPLNLCADI